MATTDNGSAEQSSSRQEVKEFRAQLEDLQSRYAADAQRHQLYVEELRAANEELDTHREELQSLNAELLDANRSLQDKIGELGRANGDLRNLVAATAIATVFLDRELRVTRYTPAAAKLFHLIQQDLGRPLSDLRQGLDYAEMEADATAVLTHRDPVEREIGGTKGGWFLARLLPYCTVEDRVDGVVLTCVDITERKQAEVLRLAKEAAERVARARNEFLSRMSHELRTPLNAILGFGQLLEFDTQDEKHRSTLGLIVKAGHHLLALVNEVLDLSQAENGQLRLAVGAVDLGRLGRECLGLVSRLAESKQVVCDLQEPPPSLDPLWTDEQRLRQVLLNLLTNAIKYNRPGGRVTLGYQQEPSGVCRLIVRDTGLGIASEDLPRLFVPFERLHGEHSEIEGTGLGLAISRRLIEMLGGSITVETKVGSGSEFCVVLPVGPVAPNRAEAAGDAPLVPPAPLAQRSVTLLCIEDNTSNAQLVQMLVERCWPQWRCLLARNARKGLEEARRQVPDLIFLDYQLPDRPGDWVLAKLRGDPRTARIPVLVLTADATADTKRRLLEGGATDFLSKPFRIDEWKQAVDKALSPV